MRLISPNNDDRRNLFYTSQKSSGGWYLRGKFQIVNLLQFEHVRYLPSVSVLYLPKERLNLLGTYLVYLYCTYLRNGIISKVTYSIEGSYTSSPVDPSVPTIQLSRVRIQLSFGLIEIRLFSLIDTT